MLCPPPLGSPNGLSACAHILRGCSPRPSNGLEHRHRIQVIPPVHHLAFPQRDHGDIAVGVRSPARYYTPLRGVFEHYHTSRRIAMYAGEIAPIENQRSEE